MLWFFLLSCAPCHKDRLAKVQNINDLASCCRFPSSRKTMWDCSTPPPPKRTIRALRDLHQNCGLEALSDINYFSMNTGNSIQAARIYFWLRRHHSDQARRIARLYLGEPLLERLNI